MFGDYVGYIYLLEIGGKRNTIDTAWSTSCLDLLLEIENYLNDLRFHMLSFPANVNITVTAYEECISQLIQYPRACASYQNIFDRWGLQTNKISRIQKLMVLFLIIIHYI